MLWRATARSVGNKLYPFVLKGCGIASVLDRVLHGFAFQMTMLTVMKPGKKNELTIPITRFVVGISSLPGEFYGLAIHSCCYP